jgi:hypothetical protein
VSIVVVLPSRGRPAAAAEAIAAIRETAVLVETSVVLTVDADDPCLPEYRALRFPTVGTSLLRPTTVVLEGDETGNLTRATNTISLRIAKADPDAIIGNLNDDHRARTRGWDRVVTEALKTPGIAYGDDLIHGVNLPSAPFMSARICLALGWYALPSCEHLYIDDAWRELGKAAGVLRYLPELVFEHLHESVGKAVWDEGYARGYAHVDEDHAAFDEWVARYQAADVANVLAAIA